MEFCWFFCTSSHFILTSISPLHALTHDKERLEQLDLAVIITIYNNIKFINLTVITRHSLLTSSGNLFLEGITYLSTLPLNHRLADDYRRDNGLFAVTWNVSFYVMLRNTYRSTDASPTSRTIQFFNGHLYGSR